MDCLNRWRRQLRNGAFGQGSVLVLTSVLVSIVNFGFNLVMGKKLQLHEFGTLSMIGALIAMVDVPLSSLSRTLTHRVAYLGGKYHRPVSGLWYFWRRKTYVWAVLLTLSWLLMIPILGNYFQLSSTLPLLILTPMWLLSVPAAVDAGFLSGSHKFVTLAMMAWVGAITTMVLTWVMVEMGWGEWLYMAWPISSLAAFGVGVWGLRKAHTHTVVATVSVKSYFPMTFYRHSLILKLTAAAFISIDLLMAKHFLSAEDAGRYAILALVGKAMFYTSSLLGQFVVPVASKDLGSGRNPRNNFLALLGVTLIMLLAIYLGLIFGGNYFIPWWFGEKAMVIVPLIALYGLGMMGFGLILLVISYYHSKHVYGVTYISLIGLVVVGLGMWLHHNSVEDIAGVMAWGGVINLLLITGYILARGLRHRWGGIEGKILTREMDQTLPETIGGYRLTEELSVHVVSKYRFGLYRNKKGELGFLKYTSKISGRREAVVRLRHEAALLQYLRRVSIHPGGKRVKPEVAVVGLIDMYEDDVSVWVLMEHVKQAQMDKVRSQKLYKQYDQVLEFLSQVSSRSTERIERLVYRNGRQLGLFLGIWIGLLCLRRPRDFRRGLSLVWVWPWVWWQLKDLRATTLAHRDLHEGNLGEQQGIIKLLDLEYMAVTVADYDGISLFCYHYNNRQLRQLLWKRLITNSTTLPLAMAALGIYVSVLRLMAYQLTSKEVDKYFKVIDFWRVYANSAPKIDWLKQKYFSQLSTVLARKEVRD